MQKFEIINGVYVGPEIWIGDLDMGEYKDTLVSLGSLTEVKGSLRLYGCTNLVYLGSLTKVGRWANFGGCTSLTSLGSLRGVGYRFDLYGCTNLTSLGSLEEVGGNVFLDGCTSLTSLGSLKEVRYGLFLGDGNIPLQDLQEKVLYYSSLPLHEALNALHTEEVQKVPLYKNILLQTLQGG
jgi:hypothetical protein